MNQCISILTLLLLSSASLLSQTIVSTTPQNKVPVLEYFGGMYCGYCPEADDIVMQIEESFDGEIVIINVQSGYFAIPQDNDPDLRSDWGVALDQLSGNGQFYPAGTVNRHHFPGYELVAPGTTAMDRNIWEYAVHQISDQASPVNVALEATFDPVSNTINVYLEYFYTSNCLSDTNYLHVALLQNEVIAPQLQNDQSFDLDYVHNYLLRDYITPQWGAPIVNTASGSFESRSFTYALPATFRDVMVDIHKLEVVAFISVDQQEILSGTATPLAVHEPISHIDINLWQATLEQTICHDQVSPNIVLRNDGAEPLSEMTIEYSVNEGPVHSHVWNGTLAAYETANIDLPAIDFEAQYGSANTLEVQIASEGALMEDANLSNNIIHAHIPDVPSTSFPTITLELRTDDYGYETYWEILDSEGNLVIAGGNQNVGATGGGQQTATANDPGAYLSNSLITQDIELPGFDCYQFRILDDYADGICCDYGIGYYRIKDEEGNVLFHGGYFDTEKKDPFRVSAAITATQELSEPTIAIFPNPVHHDQVNLTFETSEPGEVAITLFDANGKDVLNLTRERLNTGQHQWNISTTNLPNGMYFVRVQFDGQVFTKKLVVLQH